MSAALDRIRRVVTVDWPNGQERGAKALLIRTARSGHQAIMADASNKGLAPTWDAYANSPGNKDIDSVRLPGPIVYTYRYLSDLIQVALDELREKSPVLSGNYVRSHTLFVNGSPVEVAPKTLKAGDQIYIANPVPYARKIELGKTKAGRAFVIHASPHLYERVAKSLASRYRGQAKISFGFVDLGSYALQHNQASRSFLPGGRVYHAPGQRKDRAKGASVKSPAIFISPMI